MSSLFLYFQSPVFFLIFLIEIALCVHVARSGRNYYWMFIILVFPTIGALIYFIAEILPGFLGGSRARTINRGIMNILNPYKDTKDARRALEIAPTVANRIRLGRLLLERKSYDEALEVLKPALTNSFEGDPAILEGLAIGYYGKKDYAQALVHIEQIAGNKDWPVKPNIELLRARLYETQNQPGPADEIYSRLAKTSSGEEAKLAYGQFLVAQKRAAEAKPIFEDIVKRSEFMLPHARRMEGEWIRLARKELAKDS